MRKTCLHDRRYNVSNPRFGDLATHATIERYSQSIHPKLQDAKEREFQSQTVSGNRIKSLKFARFIHSGISGYTGCKPQSSDSKVFKIEN